MWSREERGFRSTFKDSTALTLHVLARAAFGFQYDFRDSSEEILPKNHVRGYRECLSKVFQMYNIVYLNIVPDLVFRFRWTPWQLRDLKVCSLELNKYLVESVEACKKSGGPDSDKNLNFLESLVRENQVTDSKSGGLSDQELYGNLFTWTLGGHETTAHTLGFAIFLLAAFPTVQDWLFEELDGVPLTYESFPRMKRCLAVMVSKRRYQLSELSLKFLSSKACACFLVLRLLQEHPAPCQRHYRPWKAKMSSFHPTRMSTSTYQHSRFFQKSGVLIL